MECFSIYSSEVEGRIDPYYYRPEFIELEKKISKKTNKKINDLIISLSGGATPSRKQDSELYSDKINGVPFLRVQNITEEGLVLDDVKYITKEVHNGELKRSQVKEDNLLITITGRIASSCVVPKGFEGNINQHSVVIKTNNRKTSEIIAKFLNLPIGQKLALRRTSGGSRPALDYQALKSIPIIIDEKMVSIMNEAYLSKKLKETESQKLLAFIDDYLLNELGIKIPEIDEKKIYSINCSDIKDKRLDAEYYQQKFKELENAINFGKYDCKKIKDTLDINNTLENIDNYNIINYIDLSSINKELGKISYINTLNKENIPSRARQKLSKGDLLLSGLSGSLKSIAVFEIIGENYIGSTGFYIIKKSEKYNNYYLWGLFRTKLYQLLLQREATGAIMSAINIYALFNLKIPFPPLPIQNKIAEEVKNKLKKAEQLKKDAKEELEKVKLEVEKIILSD